MAKDILFEREEKLQKAFSYIRKLSSCNCNSTRLEERVRKYISRVYPEFDDEYIYAFCSYALSFRELCFFECSVRCCPTL